MQHFNIGNTSLVQDGGVKPAEIYIPLWFQNGSSITINSVTTAGTNFILDGSGSTGTTSSTNARLHTLSSNWSSSTKFALESTMLTGSTSSVQLYDFTASSLVAGTTLTTTAGTFSVSRSAQFNLVSGHVYGITAWTPSGGSVQISDVSLIVFP